jgi:ubiquinone/menaquinone biosynthesis C-methylase UbiE
MSSRFADAVVVLDGHVLWHARTGRHLALAPETLAEIERWTPGLAPPPDLQAVARRLDELHMLRESAPVEVASRVPCRSRLVLTFPGDPSLWMPVPQVHPAGGHPWRALPLTAGELAFWRACNGSRTVAQAAEAAGIDVPVEFLAALTSPQAQALQLRDAPVTRRDPSLERLVTPERMPNVRTPGAYTAAGLAEYHAAIDDGPTHFDDRETTVAHAFGVPHAALGGQRYGERLHDVLAPLPDGLVVEIGPGDGELGAALLARAGRPLDYLRVDASPELLRTQRARMPGTREVLGSATALPLPDRAASLVICNEVIADLAAVPHEEAADRIRRYRLPTHDGLYNVGAWTCLEEIARVLAPGGRAVITEFGGVDEIPTETAQLDHPEVSIHFGHLHAIARALGLAAKLEPLADFMSMDLRAQQLARHSYEGLRARMRAEGRHLAARAWDPDTLALPWPVEGLQWVPLSDEGAGPLVTRFMALSVRR